MSAGRRVVVVGGGLAGVTTALDCAEAGADVTLVEVRRRLGGAAYSFERDGLHVDNGQHVFLRCCHAYRGLLARLGSERHVRVQDRLEIPVMSPGKPTVVLRRGSLPPPLHLAGALARYPHLSPAQRLSAALAARALSALDPSDPELDRRTLGDWLSDLGQSERSLAALWDLIALPTLNVPAAEASLALGAFVFQKGLLASADAGDIGFHVGTLGETIGDPAERALIDAGVEFRLGWRAQALRRADGGFEVDGPDDEGLSADAVVVALPHSRAAALVEPLLAPTAAALAQLGNSPIVNVHVVYDRVVCEQPFAAGVGTPVQYLFDRSAAGGAPPGCQYLAVSLSGAEREMQLSVSELRARYIAALAELLPAAGAARVETFFVTREHAATFRAAPGVGALRPPARTTVAGLALAGTWTDTGWPATLEGAVISGHAAAEVVLGELELAPVGAVGERGGGVTQIVVAAPLALEQALIRSGARGAHVRRTGMGPDKSLAAAARLAREPGAALLVLGFCGGLDAESRPGEVIVAEEVLAAADEGHEPVRARCDGVAQLTAAIRAGGIVVRSGPIVGVAKIATGERREQLRAAGALAVDMESAWLSAGAAGRPFAVVRVVLDSPSHELFRPQALAGALRAAGALRRASAIALQSWDPEG